MNVPQNLKYTRDNEWVEISGNKATVGITDFAQSELGDIVFLEVDWVFLPNKNKNYGKK